MTMSSVLRMNRPLIGRFVFPSSALFARVMLRRMMNVFFRGVRRRDNADRAP